MGNRLPTGPGSRGGRWHDPEYRRAYYRAWRASHPDYRERERLRRARSRAERSGDLGAIVTTTNRRRRPLPLPAMPCGCADCACREEVVVTCGFCRDGLHRESRSA